MIHPRTIVVTTLLCLGVACRASSEDAPHLVTPAGNPVMAAADAKSPDAGEPALRTPDEVVRLPVADGEAHAEIGQPAPDFELPDLYGRAHKLSAYRGKLVVLEWFDPVCPAVVYAYGEGQLREMKARHASNGIVWLAINSDAPGEPGADPRTNREFAATYRLRQPILLDPAGIVGRTYGAHTTPHLYVINERGLLVYSGALDNAPRGRVESLASKTNYVDVALADLRSGHAVITSTTRPYGCEIKYAHP